MTTRRRHGPQPVAFALSGGMDLVSAQIEKRPGMPIAALNYEPVAAGYRRLRGFERYDGHAAPSGATSYAVVHFTSGNTGIDAIVQGSLIRHFGGVGALISYAVAVPVITSGTTAGGDAAGYIGVTPLSMDAVVTGGTINAITIAAFASVVVNEAVPEAANGAWLAAAVATRRASILAVPGSGPIRGVWSYKDKIFAIRDNVGATAGVMYEAAFSILGTWTASTLARTYTFNSGGTYTPVVGDSAYDAVTSAGGPITAITLTSGTWAGGNAAGTITIAGTALTSGNNVDIRHGAPSVTELNDLTLTNGGTAYALPAGGSYEFLNHNFYGASNLERMYGVNGVGQAIVYDRTTAVLGAISTGMTTDTPTHLAEHNRALFLSFPGGSLQFSTVGEPLAFSPVTGAGEIGVGSDITALIPANKSTLAILAQNSINVLYGHDSGEYQLEVLTDEAGAIAHSAQRIGQVVYLDNEGVRSLSASAAYGNFNFGSMSQLIAPFLEDKRVSGIAPAASYISREKGQYWLIFTDGTGIAGFFGRKSPEWLPFNLGITVTCACSVEVSGNERIFLGASDGYVYEFDVGTSFDGSAIEHYLRLPFNNFGSPQIEKRVHKVILDIEVPLAATLSISVDYDYGSVVGLAAQTLSMTVGGSAMTLGTGESYYAAQIESAGEVYIDGVAKNFSLKIAGSTSTQTPHTLSAVTYLISARGLAR